MTTHRAAPPPATRPLRDDLLPALCVGVAAVAFQLPVFDRIMSLLDEGHILQFADLLTRGGELYRDATLLPLPGSFYLLAGVFEIFGPSIRVARWLVVTEFALFAMVVFLLLRRVLPASAPGANATVWAGVAVTFLYKVWAFPHWLMYSYSTTALLLLAGALLAVLHFQASARPRALVAAGLLCGLVVLCKQDYGAAGMVAIALVLWLGARSAPEGVGPRGLAVAAWFGGPVVALGALTALHYLRQGLFLEMLQQTALNHLLGISTGEYSSLPPLLPLFEQVPMFRDPYGFAVYAPSIFFTIDWGWFASTAFYQETFLWDLWIRVLFYAPYAIALAACVRLFRRRARLRDPERRLAWLGEATLGIFATALILALNKPVDWVHVAVLYWPFLLLLVLWTRAFLAPRPRLARAALIAGALPALAVVGYSGRLTWKLHDEFSTPLPGERAGIFVKEIEAEVIGEAIDYLRDHTRPGERAAVLPYFPLISFLAERDAPHRELYTFWPVEYDPQRQPEVIEALRENANALIYHFTQWIQLPRMREFAPEVFAHLVDEWEIDRVFSDVGWGYMLAALRRSDGPAPGRPLLGPDAQPTVRIDTPGEPSRVLDAAQRDHFFARELWPFRRVWALRPSQRVAETVLEIPLRVPPESRLRTAVGVDPVLWFRIPTSWVEYGIRAVVDDRRVQLFRLRIDPHRDRADRRWFEVDVDLARFAGQRIQLEFTTQCVRRTGQELAMGGFEVPRLVAAEPTGTSP